MSKITQLNVDELKGFLKHMVTNNQYIQNEGKVPVAINIEGDAGLGKTSAIVQLGKEMDMDVVKINLSQIEELGDLVGFPVKEFKIQNKEGKSTWIMEAQVDAAMKKGYKVVEKRMAHAAPEWIQGRTEGGFLVLDDYTRADHRFMQATMEILDRQEYISWSLPKNWHVILTTNPDNGEYQVTSLDDAQKTRFISTEVKFDANVWARWAEKVNIDGRCINFLLMNPEIVTQKVNPRSITTFFNSISSIQKFEDELPLINMIGDGSIGEEPSALFAMFINNKLDKLVTPKDLLTHDNEQYILGELTGCIGKDDAYRADIASTLATRLANFAVVYSKDNTINQKITDRLEILCTKEYFTNDLKYLVVRTIFNGNKQKFNKLMMKPEIIKMTVK